MNESYSYERVLKLPRSHMLRRLSLLILGCLFLLSLWAVVIALLSLFYAPVILMIPVSLLLLLLPTWKYCFVEYEYIFIGGMFYFSKIYGKRRRKQLLSVELSRVSLLVPSEEEYRKRAAAMSPSAELDATVGTCDDAIWLMVYDIGQKDVGVVFFHADERTLRALRHFNPHATVRTFGR